MHCLQLDDVGADAGAGAGAGAEHRAALPCHALLVLLLLDHLLLSLNLHLRHEFLPAKNIHFQKFCYIYFLISSFNFNGRLT